MSIDITPEKAKAYIIRIVQADGRDRQATSVLEDLVKTNPSLLIPNYSILLESLSNKSPIAVKRDLLRVIQYLPVQDETAGILYQQCMEFLLDADISIAVKAYSMTICANIVDQYPEMSEELEAVIRELMIMGSPAIMSRGRHVLKRLTKVKSKEKFRIRHDDQQTI